MKRAVLVVSFVLGCGDDSGGADSLTRGDETTSSMTETGTATATTSGTTTTTAGTDTQTTSTTGSTTDDGSSSGAGTSDGSGPRSIDLADIVGGGDGLGTGAEQGIDILTGAVTTTSEGALDCPVNTFVEADNPLVDGVFCPDGGADSTDAIVVTSTGLTVTGVPDWEPVVFTQSTWDHLWNGNSNMVETMSNGPQIGAHASKGITFDLDAIEAAHGNRVATTFTGAAAIGTRQPNDVNENVITFQVYVDGEQLFEQIMAQDSDASFPISIALEPDDRFLTLIASPHGDIQSDWSYWDAPVVELQ